MNSYKQYKTKETEKRPNYKLYTIYKYSQLKTSSSHHHLSNWSKQKSYQFLRYTAAS